MGPGPSPGGGSSPDMALAALDGMNPMPPQGAAVMDKVTKALDLAYKLIMTALPQLENMNPKLAKDLHGIAQRLLADKLEVGKEQPQMAPPPDMMVGMAPGLPSSGGGSSPFGP